ncbi:MAG TPA: hypothetical protein VF174_16745 [Micromonosporaceae bacterium]
MRRQPEAGAPETSPRPIVPVPVSAAGELRGRRVIVGVPGLGWRADLRADNPVVRGSRTFVPVIPEHEWYRAELEQVEVFAPLVPAERVWVEGTATGPVDSGLGGLPRTVSLDAPPRRDPVPITASPVASGHRVVYMADGVEQRDLRAVTELHTGDDGGVCVRVAAEADWYRWAWTGQTPRTLAVPAHLTWLE